MDHAAGLPYFTEKTGFRGKVFMTHPTKAIYKWMLSDYVRVTAMNQTSDEALYTEAELSNSYEKISTIDYHQEIEFDGIRFTALNAGHVLGAAMFLIEIAGVRLLYTGDYSREEDRHLMAAETPAVKPEVLICESTYGVAMHQPRAERELRFTSLVHEVVKRGGRCLIPVFALGRAQELLLILDEYWQAHPELHPIPIYYASPMANKCMAVYQTYVNMMNEKIRKQIAISNPFIFKHVQYLKGASHALRDHGPCVVFASPGMLQNGLSRELLEAWAPHRQNGLLVPGYVVDGTMGKFVLTNPKEITSVSGVQIPLRMSVDYISFSAHVDFAQNSEFIDLLKPPHLILVHGEQAEMFRLRAALSHKFGLGAANRGAASVDDEAKKDIMTIHTPRNCEAVTLSFGGEKPVKIVGRLAKAAKDKEEIDGVLVEADFEYQLVHPDDLAEVANVKPIKIVQSQTITSNATPSLVQHILSNLAGASNVVPLGKGKTGFSINQSIEVLQLEPSRWTIVWEGDVLNDLLADSAIAVLMSAEILPSSVKLSSSKCSHSHGNDDMDLQQELKEYLEGYFGPVDEDSAGLSFDYDFDAVRIEPGPSSTFTVACDNEEKRARVQKMVSKLTSLVAVDHVI